MVLRGIRQHVALRGTANQKCRVLQSYKEREAYEIELGTAAAQSSTTCGVDLIALVRSASLAPANKEAPQLKMDSSTDCTGCCDMNESDKLCGMCQMCRTKLNYHEATASKWVLASQEMHQ